MLLNVSALYLFRRERYLVAGVVAALASATRPQGIVLLVFFAASFLLTHKKRNYKKLIPVVLGLAGLVGYMVYLALGHYHDPLAFIHAQQSWGRLSSGWLSGLFDKSNPTYLWFIPIGLIGLWSVYKYLDWPYFLYSLAFFLMPIMTGSLQSFNRFLLCLLPMFLALAVLSIKIPKFFRLIYISGSIFLLAWSVILFANGYWVA